MKQIHEECGLFGVYSQKTLDVAKMAYYGLYALQHRGQQACGIVVNDDGLFASYKDLGLVNDVFTRQNLERVGKGQCAVAHVLYGTKDITDRNNAQPIVVNHIKGRMALAHNGSIVNAPELRARLELKGSIFHTSSDTEVISYLITESRLTCGSIEKAVEQAVESLSGAYSLLVMSPTKLIAVRDKYGFRPLCYGKTEDDVYVVASESCALDSVGAKFVRELKPGEIVVFDKGEVRSITTHCNKVNPAFCVFEYIYFARPDSVIEGCSVHDARVMAGRILAREHKVDADVVIGVPDSGLDAAIGYSQESGIPYEIGFLKNKYIGRTFIAPGQENREDKVRIKLNPISSVVKGKRVVLIDDSIVRGTTCARIVRLLREAGATEIHMRVSAPAFINPCYYGTDIDSKENLIACHYSVEEINKIIGTDTLGYLSMDGVKSLTGEKKENFYCTACFDGLYPTKVPSEKYKNKFEQKISENKNKKEQRNEQ